MVGIQVGAVSFVDEGTDNVLDNFREIAAINTLFLQTFTYCPGLGGGTPLDRTPHSTIVRDAPDRRRPLRHARYGRRCPPARAARRSTGRTAPSFPRRDRS